MRHAVRGKKFGRKTGDRRQFMRVLLQNFIVEGSITTTSARARELKWRAEKLITLGKKQTLGSLRLLTSRLPVKAAMKVYHELAPQFVARSGGYTRIEKLVTHRKRDGADQVRIQFVS